MPPLGTNISGPFFRATLRNVEPRQLLLEQLIVCSFAVIAAVFETKHSKRIFIDAEELNSTRLVRSCIKQRLLP